VLGKQHAPRLEGDIDALSREFVERGAKIKLWAAYGRREFGTQDIDGHDIGFGQIVS
jgi:hypothetical protein